MGRDHANLSRMAWEWVAPVTTGVVGVAAGLFAWLGARTGANTQVRLAHDQQAHDRETWRRTERRDIFAVYLAAVDTMYQRLADAGINVGGPPFDPDSPASPEVLAMYEAWRDLIAMTQKVRLFGSRAVRHAADLLLRNTLELVKRVGSGQDLPIHPLDAKVMDQVMVAMREDLGVG